MAVNGFSRALSRVLVHEGGKVDDPHDNGGRTNQGVTQRTYNAYLSGKGMPPRDVWDMHPAERDAIYRKQYWDVCHCDELPAGLDYVVFDGAVNSGPSRSAKWLQRAVGVDEDGVVGMITVAAAQRALTQLTIDKICDNRMAFLRGLDDWPRYKNGWTTRVSGVRKTGKAWAADVDIEPPPSAVTPKATKPVEPEPAVPGFIASILLAIFGRKA